VTLTEELSLMRQVTGGQPVKKAATAKEAQTSPPGQKVMPSARHFLIPAAIAIGAVALGVGVSFGLLVAYIMFVDNVYHSPESFWGATGWVDRPGSGEGVVRGLEALSALLYAVSLLFPLGLSYWAARLLRVNTLGATAAAAFLVGLLAFPALLLLTMTNYYEIHRSFPIPGLEWAE